MTQASAQQQARRAQHIRELCAASLRAMTGERQLHYRGERLHRGTATIAVHAPHLRPEADAAGFDDYRAIADSVALRLLHSDTALHRSLAPEDAVARLMFEWLEQLRVESLRPDDRPGMARNLEVRFIAWSTAFHRAGHTQGEAGELIYTVIQICWARLFGRSVVKETEGYIETRRGEIAPALGAVAGLRRHRHDQAAFADYALKLAYYVSDHLQAAGAAPNDDSVDEPSTDCRALALLLDSSTENEPVYETALSGHSKTFAEAKQHYRVFTRAYDREDAIESVVRAAQLESFRARLDRLIAESQANIRRLARLFAARLSVPVRDGWRFGEEAGYIDGRRLAQLVSDPAERRVFTLERYTPRADCLVSFLIDCSGSMKTHREFLASLVDILCRALSMAGVITEVLGFTTGAWNGVRAQRDWIKQGRPVYAGRLNETRHLIFKPADRSWRRGRRGVCGLLREDLYREGVDGEAVDWACDRMLGRDEPRRILVVVSDGCPMDRATAMANDEFYLDNHLKDVVERRQRRDRIDICGLGVGLDLSAYYRHSRVVDPAEGLSNNALFEVLTLITGRQLQD